MEKLNQQNHLKTEEIKGATPPNDSVPENSQVSTEQVVGEAENLPDYGPIRISAFGPNIYGDFHN